MHDEKFDEQKGKMKEVGGKAQQAVGDLTDDEEMRAKGAKNEAEGKTQGAFGKIKNAVGDLVDEAKDALDPNSKDPTHDDATRRRSM